jgi:hypothetical protein
VSVLYFNCGQSVSALRGKRYTEISLFTAQSADMNLKSLLKPHRAAVYLGGRPRSAATIFSAMGWYMPRAAANQGLTLVRFSAQGKRFL